ncbi:MAG: hypothetical protein K6G22_14225 [Lachnospiraceae bacterium]|nr:hypothetical protein [Lachnospiraceae bacterium]
MTKKTLKAACDCISKIKDQTPTEAQIKEMLSFLSEEGKEIHIGDDNFVTYIVFSTTFNL